MNRASHKDHQHGFTLVETMIALAVFAIIASASTGLLSVAIQSGNANTTVSNRMAQVSIARSLMRDDFLQMILRPVRDEFGSQNLLAFEGGFVRDRITIARFSRRGRTNPGGRQTRGNIQHVHYLFEEGRIIRRTFPQIDPAPDVRPYDQVLFENIASTNVRFLITGAWQTAMEIRSDSNATLPVAVEVTLAYESGETLSFMLQGTGERIA